MKALSPLLIANRGEIAVRIAATACRLGIATVAIASDADAGAPHTTACDRTVAIGGERPADSYLRIDKVIDAAKASGAGAVHPGYGFLGESAELADAVAAAGLVWVGPPPAAMRAMADKASARRRMATAGVPVLPGYDGAAQDIETLRSEAARIGFPLMVKATAGGGGRGMRVVADASALAGAVAAAAAEARSAFGNATLLLERAAVGARHVEIQVFADGHGSAIHLGERDCSVQRRHQKLIEEAPSPAVSPALRRRMGEVAVAAASAVGYVGAGTVEFLLEPSGDFWFIEMNTRLQVEHAVTEALVGVDLVEWQLRVAAGEALPLAQDEALARYERGGHAIEARLCAEDPGRGDLPQSGRVVRWRPPPGVRCDHALASGAVVSPFYDSMLAKLVAHAPRRDEAVARLATALDATVCFGVATNRAFLARVLRDPAFAAGDVDTTFLARRFGSDAARAPAADSALAALAAATIAVLPRVPLPALWAGWSTSAVVEQEVPLDVGGVAQRWRLDGTRDAAIVATCDGARHRIEGLRWRDGDGDVGGHAGHASALRDIEAIVDGHPLRAAVAFDGASSHWLSRGVEIGVVDERLRGRAGGEAARPGRLLAPMHGRVTSVAVGEGDAVAAGALILVVEAMKMEHEVRAPHAGRVAALAVRAGDQVAARQALVEIRIQEPEPESGPGTA